ncbi:hypothetical protein COTS27_01406 [Spirochaetota bacterium]|nr:hypothetical protein COTS27_01406 [Spirochaetota bacterium]
MNNHKMKWNSIYTLMLKEVKGFFFSPVAYVVATVFFIVSGVFFWPAFFVQNQAELRSFFAMLPWSLTFIIPALTMRLFAEERQSGSYEMLYTLPVTLEEIIVGKFCAVLVFLLFMLSIVPLYGITVSWVGDLNWGIVWGGFFGALFLGAFYAAVGLFASSLTKNQVIAFIIGLCIALLFFLVDKFFVFLPQSIIAIFNFFSSDIHFKNITKGVLDIRDILFFVWLTYIFLWLTQLNLKKSIR